MPYNAVKNLVFHQRIQNLAVAYQNLREEGERLRDMYLAEVAPGGVQNAAFVDTTIASKAEVISIIDYISDVRSFNGSVAVGAANRASWLLPLVDTNPA
jgi:hypothetical protein